MKSSFVCTIAMAGALSIALAGTASATVLGHPKHHPKPKPKSVTQVTGKRLASALLPASAFGAGDTASSVADTGNSLLPSQPGSLSGAPCSILFFGVPVVGQTAAATDIITSQGSLVGGQSVSQFPGNQAAWSFYGQLKAKYSGCESYTVPVQGSQETGTITLSIDLQGVSNARVRGNSAFTVTQVAEVSDSLGDTTLSLNTTVVSDGKNVYTVAELNSANTPVPDSLLTSLISRTQALYKA